MRKRKFTSTRFTIKMAAVAAPTLLPLTLLASPSGGQSHAQVRGQRVVATTSTATANSAVSALIPVVGKVTLPDGKPAANARIYVTWLQTEGSQPFHKCVADANGKFETTITPTGNAKVRINSAILVTALLPGKGIAWTQVPVGNPNLSKVQLNLMPLATLEGRLVHTDGTPNANTEVRVVALTPRATIRNGVSPAPTTPTKAELANVTSRLSVMQQSGNFFILPILPPDALAEQFRATTDANGKFTFNGIPRDTTISLKPGGKLAMAAGSANMFAIQDQERQNAGLFVATPTVRVKVRVYDLQTHQPVPQMPVRIASVNMLQNMALMHRVNIADFHGFRTDAKGEMTSLDLLPGDYVVNALGCMKTAHLEAGQDTPTIDIAVRHGFLRGRLLDADGKPVVNADVRLAAAGNTNGRVFVFTNNGNNNVQFINGDFGGLTSGLPVTTDGKVTSPDFNGAVPTMMMRTGADGTFTIPNMPWGSPQIRIWATKGNDLAEWSGPASKADANLTLQLRRNVLMTVSGRLVDPERRPLAKVTCKTLHWLSSPRSTWFATARDVTTDADGNFKVDGMERGESFSLITVGQSQLSNNSLSSNDTGPAETVSLAQNDGVENALQTLGNLPVFSRHVIPIRQDFESPRFMTCATGDGQSLGEVMVHPHDTPDEVLQSYDGSPGDQPTLPGVVAAPTPGDVQAAQAVLARFDNALKTGDVDALNALTSRVSPGWSSNRQAFLRNVSLCGRVNTDEDAPTRALNFVPRSTVAALLKMAPQEAGAERAERVGEKANAPADWVFLNRQVGGAVVTAGILHREAGEWRVVANHSFAMPLIADQIQTPTAASKWEQTATALTPELLQEARQAGELYMQAWRDTDREQMRRLTSPFAALPNGNLARFRHALEHRADDGVCPLDGEEKISLLPVTNLTLWEQNQMKHLAGMNAPMNVNGMSVITTERGETVISTQATAPTASETKSAPEKLAPGQDTAVLRYSAQGRNFLMVLTRHNQHWQMLEPAMPL